MSLLSVIPVIVGAIGSFAGGYLAKSIELKNEFGDYYYFLKSSKKAIQYCSVYGLLSVTLLLLISYTSVFDKEFIPDLSAFSLAPETTRRGDEPGIASHIYVLLTSFLVGFSSKGILDMPVGRSRSAEDTHFRVKDVLAFLFPEVKKSFQNIIRANEIRYFNASIEQVQQKEVKEIAKVAYLWLQDKIDWRSEDKRRQLDIMMTELAEIRDKHDALRYLYRNLGREEFEYAFGLR